MVLFVYIVKVVLSTPKVARTQVTIMRRSSHYICNAKITTSYNKLSVPTTHASLASAVGLSQIYLQRQTLNVVCVDGLESLCKYKVKNLLEADFREMCASDCQGCQKCYV